MKRSRSKQRDTRRTQRRTGTNHTGIQPWKIVIAALLVLAVASVAVFGVVWFNDFKVKNASRNKLESAVTTMGKVDETLRKVDTTINSKTTTETVGSATKILAEIEPSLKKLQAIETSVVTARESARKEDRQFADALIAAVDGREQMLISGQEIVSLDTSASVALGLLDEGWDKMLEAHRDADKAVSAANKETRTGVKASLAINKDVRKKLLAAQKDFKKVQEMFPAADFSKFMTYIDGRIKANGYAIESDEAVLDKKVSAANSAIEKLNKQNTISAKQIKKISTVPQDALGGAYQEKAQEVSAQYAEAKKMTAEADEMVRKFM